MRPIRSASVLVPTFQAMEFLERVFDALAKQETSLDWDVYVIDSGSTDGTLEYLRGRVAEFPTLLTVESIPSAAFDHGDTRNLLACRARGELLVLLTQDAIPSHSRWLETLARNFDDPRVGAAYSRNIPRADCWELTRIASEKALDGMSERAHFSEHPFGEAVLRGVVLDDACVPVVEQTRLQCGASPRRRVIRHEFGGGEVEDQVRGRIRSACCDSLRQRRSYQPS